MEEETTIIMAALSTLSSPNLSDLTHSIFTLTHRCHNRRLALLSSPALFSLTLHHLHTLSLPKKTLLIARFLLSSLHLLTQHFQQNQLYPSTAIRHRDLDTVLLLLLLCEIHRQNPEALKTPVTKWQRVLSQHYSNTMLTVFGIGAYSGDVLLPYIEMVNRCRRLIDVMGGGGEKEGREVATAPAAVVALPSVEVRGGGAECVICKEEMKRGRDMCELPCKHLFHWICILPWLRKRNTCPCCRFGLPTDDVFGEIQRLWEVLIRVSRSSFDGELQCM